MGRARARERIWRDESMSKRMRVCGAAQGDAMDVDDNRLVIGHRYLDEATTTNTRRTFVQSWVDISNR